ncbi:M18 family aminopeptidase [Anaeromicropila populeti]|uniref:M18 family aminopeptidase n=1 Tax=Anaeromicropila populeti TaxID=37658 RepID=A0A1I6JDR5_9FIRM|nr:M18 family aminopeptidase [Anaeromicropila populeti]SFR77091.1 aspartyl aminopeptidase [Anaeromicropila populeti]
MNHITSDLIDFIACATSPYHVVKKCKEMLIDEGFQELPFTSPWTLEKGKSYVTTPYDSTLFAFTLGDELLNCPHLRLATAHTDHPCFRIKPKAELSEHSYLQINTEAYGGLILNTWLDRPLSVAGKICLKSDSIYAPKVVFFDAKRPLLTIPNLAIHINREVNKGIELNKQTDMRPVLGLLNETLNKDNFFLNFLAQELQISPEDILTFDLTIYNAEHPCLIGLQEDFLSSPRLDNLTSALACVKGLLADTNRNNINMIALFDNEEIGSRTKQGADSSLTNILLDKIFTCLNLEKSILYNTLIDRSLILSVDVAHCLHPNYLSKNDPSNFTELGKGVVLKLDSNQKYAFDPEALSIVEQLCQTNKITYQKFVNRSDATSGSTLGSIISSWLPVKTVDLGLPLLAMHSARELMGTSDQEDLEKLIECFFNC